MNPFVSLLLTFINLMILSTAFKSNIKFPTTLKSLKNISLLHTTTTTNNFNINAPINNIIMFDGVCNFCNKWVDLVISLDSEKKFKFCALQSTTGRELLQLMGKEENDISSFVYIKSLSSTRKEFYFKSEAALKVAENLGTGLNLLSTSGRLLVPLPMLRDSFYDVIASNRYNFLGKRNECRVGDVDRFIS